MNSSEQQPAEANPTDSAFSLEQLKVLARMGLLKPWLRQQIIDDYTTEIPVSEEESQQALASFKREQGIETDAQLHSLLRRQLLSAEQFSQRLLEPIRIQRHLEQTYRAKAEAQFLKRKSDLDRVVYSLLRLRDPGLAREVFHRIDDGEADFAQLAAEYAQGPERSTRGVVGPIPLKQAHPLLAERLRNSRPGVLLEPFPLEPWWLVVRLESVAPAHYDDNTAQQMARELFEAHIEQLVQERLEALMPLGFPEA